MGGGKRGRKQIDPSTKLELKLNLSPPISRSSSSSVASFMSSSGSCFSSSDQHPEEASSAAANSNNGYNDIIGYDDHSAGGGGTVMGSTMRLLGCPQCLMYVMLAADVDGGPKCPKCKSSVLLDVLNQPASRSM